MDQIRRRRFTEWLFSSVSMDPCKRSFAFCRLLIEDCGERVVRMGLRTVRFAGVLLQCSLACAQLSSTILEYAAPTPSGGPQYITAGPDGNLWFTESSAGKIGRITTGGSVVEYPVSASSGPAAITAGPDNALWFTESGANKIGRITTTGAVLEYGVPTSASRPTGIALGPDGAIWFTEASASKIGRITTGGGIAEYATPTPGSSPLDITTGSDGALWFTESSAHKVGRVTTAGRITEFSLSGASGTPWRISKGPDGAIWFTDNGGGKIGRITATGVVFEYATPSPSSRPTGITAGNDGAVWFTEAGTNNLARATTDGVISEYSLPTVASGPAGITTGPDGNLWLVEQSAGKVAVRATSSGIFPPKINTDGIVPIYSSSPVIQPGSWVSIFGTALATTAATWHGEFPTSLGGTSVTVNGRPAYLWFVSDGQINMQAPDDTATGTVGVVVSTPKGTTGTTVTLAQFGPSFSRVDGTHVAGIIPRQDGSGVYGGGSYDILGPAGNALGYTTVPARPGDTVELFGVGFGPTDPTVLAGQPFSGAAPAINPITVSIGDLGIRPDFAGMSESGVFQMNIVIPPSVGTGDVLIQATVGGVQTPAGTSISLQ